MKKKGTRAREKGLRVLASVLPVVLCLFLALPVLTMAQEEKAPASSTAKDKPRGPLSSTKGGTREKPSSAKASPSHGAVAGRSAASPKKGGTREAEQTAHAKPSAGGSKTAAGAKWGAKKPAGSAKKSATAGHGSTTADKREHPE
jgi:hypothetical protein